MPKVKISEFSSTPANNTDIDSINIAEGCAPSGINDAIRELMAQLKDFQTGAVGDSFNGPVGTSTAAAGAFTTLAASSTVTLSGGTANGVAYLNGSKVVTSGTALVFDGTNFGVGVASPQAKIHATGTIKVATGNAQGILALGDGAGTTVNCGVWRGAANAPTTDGNFLNLGGYDGLVFAVGNAAIGSQSEVGRFTSTGLGIGTSSPSAKLDVNGTIYSRTGGVYTDTLTAYSGSSISVNAGSSYFAVSVNSSERMRLDSSGNLGLGVTPSAWDSVFKSFDGGGAGCFGSLFFQANGDYTTALGSNLYYNSGWKYKATAAAGKYELKNNTHAWYTAPSGTAGNAITFTQAMTLDASGNLLLGKTSANDTITGVALEPSQDEAYNFTQGNGAGAGWVIMCNRQSSDGDAMRFRRSNSNVGSVSVTTVSTLYNTTSDQRLKENIQDADSASSLIDALQVRQFDWKSDNSHQRYGFVAQELVTVAPEAVHQPTDAEQMMAVDYSKLVPMLVKEIQSLRKRLADAGI